MTRRGPLAFPSASECPILPEASTGLTRDQSSDEGADSPNQTARKQFAHVLQRPQSTGKIALTLISLLASQRR
jgi:hypothetical protein